MPLWRSGRVILAGGVFSAPRFHPGADALFKGSDDLPGDAGVDILPFCILHCLFLSFASRFLMTRASKGPGGMECPVTAGERPHGSRSRPQGGAANGAGQPLTGHADRPMIASRL